VENRAKSERSREAAERFLFDRSFDVNARPAKKPKPEEEKPPEPTFSREELEAARQDGHAQGHAAGVAEASAGLESEIARLVAAIGEKLPALSAAQAAANERLLHDGARLATVIARKILPAFTARHGMEEVGALIRNCLQTLIEQPRITVHVGAPYVDTVRAQLDSAASASAFEGRFLVEPDSAMGPSDCRIAWQGGGLERNEADIWRQVDAATEKYLAERDDDARKDERDTEILITDAVAAPENTDESPAPAADDERMNASETPSGAPAPLEDR
jgi:flagellar assembly protein FliH